MNGIKAEMRQPKTSAGSRRTSKLYPINQCALYKLTSPKKLCEALKIEKSLLSDVLESDENYREFTLLEEVDPFSRKIKKKRLVQTPNKKLRNIHERILQLLQRIEYPDYSHAGVKKRSYRSNALVHVNSKTIATFDLKGFYGAVKSYHVNTFFSEQLNCVGDVAGILTKLTTFRNCVPTGSPLSALLALFTSKPMFDDLDALAKKHKLKFTCYVDDLTFSGDSIPSSLERDVSSIVRKHGHSLSINKTKIYRENQPKHVTGTVILNNRIHVPHTRLLAARRLQSAINGEIESFGFTEEKLIQKLAGMLNEASYLDVRFKYKALTAKAMLKSAK
ncbi:reverse transcriptase family protein [Pseudomonas sp. GCM10022188]|uniref:reverse transcriptase family protein n=1 Tax=Pseudomonas TaxID=286 RepID=UPI001E620BCD|nr:reverse transcriptase family protein [Pseudomonas oryzagri]MCC6075378.1 reverse transcriptase family protein [Pseudomonas oryzagri]